MAAINIEFNYRNDQNDESFKFFIKKKRKTSEGAMSLFLLSLLVGSVVSILSSSCHSFKCVLYQN